jgi:hypothetical protein
MPVVEDDGLPGDVAAFLDEHIVSVEQLETLLLLQNLPDAVWTAETLSKELYTQPDSAAGWLADLTRRGLLSEHEGAYRYAPRSDLAPLVEALAITYAQRRIRVISRIFATPKDVASAFSDAFRLRKDKGRDDKDNP